MRYCKWCKSVLKSGTQYTLDHSKRFYYCPKCWQRIIKGYENNIQEPKRKIIIHRNK